MFRIIVLVYLFFVKCVYGGFFDLTDIDDPLAMLWSAKPSVADKKLTECKVDTQSGVKYGVCIAPSHCLFTGGAPNGLCGILSTCCTYEKACGKSSDSKVSYFDGTNSIKSSSCKYTIKLKNTNICQIRLDFVKFQLAPATLTALSPSSSNSLTSQSIYKCADDRLVISPNYYGIPDLCGNNDGQHVYIHINQSEGIMHSVNLEMVLADRTQKSYLVTPSWKIKITQLECPGKRRFLESEQESVQDFPMLAPLGAIQFFTDKTGYIKSFGFDGSASNQSYTYDQYYAIAFKRYTSTCGVRFVPEWFNLPSDATIPVTDDTCYHYLFVPELHFEITSTARIFQSKVCWNTLAPPESFRAYSPGPLYIHFNSQKTGITTDETQKQGFNIKYELLTQCE